MINVDFLNRWLREQAKLMNCEAKTGSNSQRQLAAWIWCFGLRCAADFLEAMKVETLKREEDQSR